MSLALREEDDGKRAGGVWSLSEKKANRKCRED